MAVFLVCSAAYTGYTDPDCNLDCVAVVVVAVWWWWLPSSNERATLHALVAVTLQNLYWWCFSWYVLPHIPVTVIVTWTVWWCMVVAVVLVVVEVVVVVAMVGVVLVALAHMLERIL